jgi:hypothetical protein
MNQCAKKMNVRRPLGFVSCMKYLDRSKDLVSEKNDNQMEKRAITDKDYVHTLTAGLEEKPLHYLRLLFSRCPQKAVLILRVVSGSQVEKDSITLPDGEVVVVMVHEGWNLISWGLAKARHEVRDLRDHWGCSRCGVTVSARPC